MMSHMLDTVSGDGRDIREYTDQLRKNHRVVKNKQGQWVLLNHQDVVQAACQHEIFSSQVSRFLQVPNGLDGQKHSDYRAIIDKYLTADALIPFIPVFERVAEQVVEEAFIIHKGRVDAVKQLGATFAVQAQCAWLGWPKEIESRLLAWMVSNHDAARFGDSKQLAQVAEMFDDIIRSVLLPRRSATLAGDGTDDVTSLLCQERIYGRMLQEAELVSILRNWTGGDLGSMALCVGVICVYLAADPQRVDHWRTLADNDLDRHIDEVLRLDNPFLSNRRITRCPVHIAGVDIPAGEVVKLHWTSACRDEVVFGEEQFDPDAHAQKNLVYGIGKHVCPGRILSTWQLRVLTKTLLKRCKNIKLNQEVQLEREISPVGGYHRVPLLLD